MNPFARRYALLNYATNVSNRYRFEKQDENAHVKLRDKLINDYRISHNMYRTDSTSLNWQHLINIEEEELHALLNDGYTGDIPF